MLLAADMAASGQDVVFVLRDDAALERRVDIVEHFRAEVDAVRFPAWDCLPYDRVSPRPAIVGERLAALSKLSQNGTGRLVLTTVSALLQRVPPRNFVAAGGMTLKQGTRIEPAVLARDLERLGFSRIETVTEPGEYAIRGGIVDVYPAGAASPVRLDFFGDELDGLKVFDAATQRSTENVKSLSLTPVSEAPLDENAISRFRSNYREAFGRSGDDDPLYVSVSEGKRHVGLEHWLAFFHDRLETLLDYLPGAAVIFDHQASAAIEARCDLVLEYFEARQAFADEQSATPYRAVKPARMFLNADALSDVLSGRAVTDFSPYTIGDDEEGGLDAGGHAGRDFADERVDPNANVYDAAVREIERLKKENLRVVVAALTDGSADRLLGLLKEHGAPSLSMGDAQTLPKAGSAQVSVIGVERGFRYQDLAVISETDILGERMARPGRRKIRPENFIAEVSALAVG